MSRQRGERFAVINAVAYYYSDVVRQGRQVYRPRKESMVEKWKEVRIHLMKNGGEAVLRELVDIHGAEYIKLLLRYQALTAPSRQY